MELKEKLAKTESMILEYAKEHGEDKIYLALSFGIQSTLLFYICKKLLGKKLVCCFADTTLEFPGNLALKNRIESEYPEIEIVTVTPKYTAEYIFKHFGYPLISKLQSRCIHDAKKFLAEEGDCEHFRKTMDTKLGMYTVSRKWQYLVADFVDGKYIPAYEDLNISNKCCEYLKLQPIRSFERITKRYYSITGELGTGDEGIQRKFAFNKSEKGESKTMKCTPLGHWTMQDILKYLYECGAMPYLATNDDSIYDGKVLYSSEYGSIKKETEGELTQYYLTGEQRTGCYLCPCGCTRENPINNRYLRLKRKYPGLWYNAIYSIGLGKYLDAIHIDYMGKNIQYDLFELIENE